MAFRLLYNNLFPLRMVNLIKKYTDTVGNIQIGNKIAGQLSKLQLIDFFFPSLFIRELPADREEAEYPTGAPASRKSMRSKTASWATAEMKPHTKITPRPTVCSGARLRICSQMNPLLMS